MVKPDLVIANVTAPARAPANLRVQVSNTGDGPSAATQIVLSYHRSGQVVRKSAPVPALQAGETQCIVIEAESPLANAEKITLSVDEPSILDESNESNNSYVFK